MSWAQFVTLHWEVWAASPFFEELKTTGVNTWTVESKRVLSFDLSMVQQVRMIRSSALSMWVLFARWVYVLRIGRPTARVPRNARDDNRRRLSDKAFLQPCIALLQEAGDPFQACPIEQDRSPPGKDVGGDMVASRCLDLGRCAPSLCLELVAQGDADSRSLMMRYSRRPQPVSNPSQIAA